LSTHKWGLVITGCYFALMVILTIIAERRTKSTNDFATGGGKLSPVALGICLAATVHSAGTFVGVGGLGFAFGLNTLWHALTIPLPTVFSVIIVSKVAHHMAKVHGSISMPDWLGHRYGSNAVRVTVGIISLMLVITVIAQYSGAATAFQSVLGIPYVWGLVIAVATVTIYTFLGGSFADVYTDVVQAVIMLVCAVCIAFSVVWVFKGGLPEVVERLNSIDPNLTAVINPKSPLFGSIHYIVIMILVYLTHVFEPQLFNKILSVGDQRQLRKFVIAFAIFMVALGLADFGGIYLRALSATKPLPGNFRPDMANMLYIQHAFSPFFAAFFQVAIIAAVMSTMDGLLVALSISVSNDIYRRFLVPKGWGGIKPDAPESEIDRKSLLISRVVVVIIGVISVVLAISPPPLMAILMLAGRGAIGAAVAGPILLGLFWKRANAQGAIASIVIGAIGFVLIYFVFGWERNPTAAQLYATIVALLAMVIVSLVTPPLPKEHIESLYSKT